MASVKNDYFKMFVELEDFSCRAAVELAKLLENYDQDTIKKVLQNFHMIEHSADEYKHECINKLVKEFITPIEREDILGLFEKIDDITDAIEDILIKTYMYCVKNIRTEAHEFIQIIIKCTNELKLILDELHDFKKSKTIHSHIIELNRLEEDGDRLYIKAMRNLYENCGDPIEINIWSSVFAQLEECCDACEHAANVAEAVIMKNT